MASEPVALDVFLDALAAWEARGHFGGRRVTLQDPDDRRVRQVYEDLDQETPQHARLALVTLHPERSQAQARGDSTDGLVVVTHARALDDMLRMVANQGYIVVAITRDLA